ncbi:PilW family protein [Timonella senegalensis]|uniref:PilW family protein n=1 Tax=Timonella senegalensis TaxID=1465825 RepID=UPI002FE20F8C
MVRAQVQPRDDSEDGMSLVELIISMAILVLLLGVTLTAVAGMSKSTVRSQAVADASDQLRTTYQRLDKEVRYASSVNQPGVVGNSIYFEYLIDSNIATGTPECVQWRYVADKGELQRRTWPNGTTKASAWQTMITRLRNDLSQVEQQPFRVQRAGNNNGKVTSKQQLDIFLDTGLGADADPRGGQLDVTFVAQNSSTNSPYTVCLIGGMNRP